MGSTRLPGKVMQEVNGKPMIYWQILRIMKSNVDGLVVAITDDPSDDDLFDYINSIGINVYRGSTTNVLARYQAVVNKYEPRSFLRLTADCPLVMPELINQMLHDFANNPCDILSNTNPPTFPDGLDIEIVQARSLVELSSEPLNLEEKEHVTLGFYRRPGGFVIRNHASKIDFSNMRWTVDYAEDLNFVRRVYGEFWGKEQEFRFDDVIALIKEEKIVDNQKPPEFRNISLRDGIARG